MMLFLTRLLVMIPRPYPLLLSATITPSDVGECVILFCVMQLNILYSPLNRRQSLFEVVVSRNTGRSLKYPAQCAMQYRPINQQIVYTLRRTTAESTMRNSANALISKHQEKKFGQMYVHTRPLALTA